MTSDIQKNPFFTALRVARKKANISQLELAKRMNVSRDLVNRMENGDNVGIYHLLNAVDILGCTLNITTELKLIDDGESFGLDDGSVYEIVSESDLKSNNE